MSFAINGIPYYKNFMPHVASDNLRVVGVYDSKLQLTPFEKYDQYNVDGTVFNSIVNLQTALLPILYTRATLGGGVYLPNIIVSVDIIKNGNQFTIHVVWRFNGIQYENEIITEIDTEADNFKRIDRIVATDQGTLIKLVGDASDDVAYPPQIDELHQMEVIQFDIYGNNIEGQPPVIGDNYITKSSRRDAFIGFTGDNVLLPEPTDRVGFRLIGAGLNSIDGILYGGGFGSTITVGDLFPITNVTGGPVALNHSGYFITDNYILRNQRVVLVRYEGNGIYRLISNLSVGTLDQVLQASLNNTTEHIVQTLPSIYDIGFETNGVLKARNLQIISDYIHSETSIETNAGITAGSFNGAVRLRAYGGQGYDLSRFGNDLIRVHRKMRYMGDDSNPVPIDNFVGQDIPTTDYVDTKVATKANDADVIHKTGFETILEDKLINNSKSMFFFSKNYGMGTPDGNGLQIFCASNDSIRFGARYAESTFVEQVKIDGSNGNVNLKGLLYLGEFTIGTEPAYQKGRTFFNASLGKMRIGGATGWETVSST